MRIDSERSAPTAKSLVIILDLDETLVYATDTALDQAADITIGRHLVYRRPHVSSFLNAILDRYTVAVWTASSSAYGQAVVQMLFGDRVDELAFVWTGERCTRQIDRCTYDRHTRKHLKKLKKRGYSLERILIIDNTPATYADNYGNAILIRDYEGDNEDDELPRLLEYLKTFDETPNVRTIEKRGWRNRF